MASHRNGKSGSPLLIWFVPDDLLHVVAGTMSAILAHRKSQGQGSSASFELSPWRENCQRMITRLSDP